MLTILPAANGPGLLVKHRDGQWITGPNEPGTVIINTGDMLPGGLRRILPLNHTSGCSRGWRAQREQNVDAPLLQPKAEVKLSDRYTAGALQERLQELGVIAEIKSTLIDSFNPCAQKATTG